MGAGFSDEELIAALRKWSGIGACLQAAKRLSELTAAKPVRDGQMHEAAKAAVRNICEWDDRTSPDGYEDYILITPAELENELFNFAAIPQEHVAGESEAEAVNDGPFVPQKAMDELNAILGREPYPTPELQESAKLEDKPFITTTSGGGEYYVTVKIRSLDALHHAHDKVMAAFSKRPETDHDLKLVRCNRSDCWTDNRNLTDLEAAQKAIAKRDTTVWDLTESVKAAEARVAELEAALEPFRDTVNELCKDYGEERALHVFFQVEDDKPCPSLPMDDFVRLCAALNTSRGTSDE